MEYLFTFIEGLASFISPCVLPMLPIYISYFIGENNDKPSKAVINAIGFTSGFTIVFIVLSILASHFGSLISSNMKFFKIVFGVVIILLGFNYMDIFKIKFLNNISQIKANTKNLNFFKSLVFGILFSLGWTPCIGTFLSSALLLVASKQSMLKGIILMLLYSIGLGIPFIISAVLLEKLQELFSFIKKHYGIIKKISGIILILMGLFTIIF